MSDDPQALQRLMDAYADGSLDPAELPALIEHLRTSESARDHLAAVAVAERLLRAAGQGGVPIDRIMAHVAAGSERPTEPVPPAHPPRGRRITMRSATGVGPRARAVVSARDRQAPPRRLPLWLFLGLLIAMAVAAGIWYRDRPAERTAQRPPVVPGPPRGAVPALRSAPSPSRETVPARVAPAVADVPQVIGAVPVVTALPPADEAPLPPMGDGSDEPGFVPPPRIDTVAPPPSNAVTPDETAIPGGHTPPMTHTEARKPPQPPVIVTKIKEE